MRGSVVSAVFAALLCVAPAAGEERTAAVAVEPVPFCVAIGTGKLAVESLGSADGRRVNVRLTNRTKEPLAVDLCTGVLAPVEPRACPRLILGPALDPGAARAPKPGQVVVALAAGAERQLIVHTCVLDVGLPFARRQRLKASGEIVRPVVAALLRWWAEFPTTPQGAVNAAVFTGRDRVLLDPNFGTVALAWGRGVLPKAVAAHHGTAYQLADGRLTSLDPERTRCDLGSEVVGVVAERDALYALFPVSNWQAELRRLVHGDERATWELLAYVTEDERPSRVLSIEADGALLLTPDAILRVLGSSPYPERLVPTAGPGGIRIDTSGQATLSLFRRPTSGAPYPVLYGYDPTKRFLSAAQTVKGLRHLRLGPAGAYAIDVQGQLVRVTGAKREPIGDLAPLRSVLAVGRHVVWLRGPGGVPFAVDPDTGREVARPNGMLEARDQDLVLDQDNGDLVGIHQGTWFRWPAKDGLTETLPAP